MTELLGSIEAGGTKFVLATADADFNIQDRDRIPTTTPAETIQGCIDFFTAHPVAALGLGSFGPIDQNLKSPTYGRILATPKPGWANTDIVGELKAALHIPIFFTTDVNASVYGEYIQGAAKDVDSACTSPSAPASAAARFKTATSSAAVRTPKWATPR